MTSNSFTLEPDNTFTIRQVAVVTDVEPRKINQFIDDRVLPNWAFQRRDKERSLFAFACPIVDFYTSGTSSWLTKEAKKEVAVFLAEKLKSDWPDLFAYEKNLDDQRTIRNVIFKMGVCNYELENDGMILRFTENVERSLDNLTKLLMAEARVVEDPDIRAGIPTIIGTRISPYEAAGMARVDGIDGARKAYPSLTREDIELAMLYAKANPLRGRPKSKGQDWRKNWRLVSEKVVSKSKYSELVER